MSMYAYDFQTCGFAIIDKVRSIVESQRDWDHSNSLKVARSNCGAAAKRFGYKRLLTAEQKALAKFLVETKAGLHIATYAWGTYADMKASANDEFAASTELVIA